MIVDPRRIELSPEQQAELAALAAQSGQPWPDVLRDALNAFRSKDPAATPVSQESLYDKTRRLGLLGCLQGGPTDLSTNPLYMEGFGEARD